MNAPRMAIIWMIVRVYVGFSWLDAGWHKIMDVGAKTNYIDGHTEVAMGKVVAFGETAVGIGLILGAFVGIAAVGGAFMNLNFMLAGSASTNPVLLLLGFLLVLAWKTAGYIGLDRELLPLLGTPWSAPKPPAVPVKTAPLPQPV